MKRMRPCDYDDGFDDKAAPVVVVGSEEDCGPAPFASLSLRKAAECAVSDIALRASLASVCESPIEIDLCAALLAAAGDQFTITPQFKLGRYRYDFAIGKPGLPKPIALVECDGKEFHRTPEQLRNDAAKDVAAAKVGLKVIRLTGREIYRDPRNAAEIVLWQCGGRS